MGVLRSREIVALLIPLFFFFLHLLLMISLCNGHAVLCKAQEREALLQFKAGFSGGNMISSWGVGGEDDCCSWNGIGCDNHTSHVVELNLRGGLYGLPSLRGKISSYLVVLKSLQRMDLSNNDFEGSPIPHFLGSFEKLTHLNLSSATFAGVIPQQLGNLSGLQFLDLSFNSFTGKFPRWLGEYTSLEILNLEHSNLSGSIPESIGAMASLRKLLLRVNNLMGTIPQSIGRLQSLEYLDLTGNYLEGSIPQSISRLQSLKHLDLTGNNLEGSIPPSISRLQSLEHLSLTGNYLMGSIPQSIGRLQSLRYLRLSLNDLTGSIPQSIGMLQSLEFLNLYSNNLTGIIPQSIGRLHSLKSLLLPNNNLMGFIPQSIGRLRSLEYLDLYANNLSGHIPPSLGELKSLQYLRLRGNSLRGNLTEEHFIHLSNLSTLDLSSNSIKVMLSPHWVPPFNLTVLGLGSCKVGPDFPLWIRTQNQLQELNMSDSDISDFLPQWVWNFSLRIRSMDLSMNNLRGVVPVATNSSWMQDLILRSNMLEGSLSSFPRILGSLSLSKNKFTGNIPQSFCKAQELIYLDLSYNLLSGQLPSCLESKYPMTLIESLHLNNNDLHGTLPAWLGNCKEMKLLDLGENNFSGKFPNWIPNSMLRLKVLRLRSNSFYGSIPMELSNLTSLQVLDLADNSFSGLIPPTIGNFSAMKIQLSGYEILTYSPGMYYTESIMVTSKGRDQTMPESVLKLYTSIDLSGNKLSGFIPDEVGKLVFLRNLNFSHNYLSGRIPETFAGLLQLESLDLSSNNLTGAIPKTLSELTFLSTFNVSFNNLSGRIPSGGQFDRFTNSSYMGNLDLCGKPLQVCQSDLSPPIKGYSMQTDQKDHAHYFVWLCLSIVLGFIMGFWTFLGTLILKRNWRYAYFKFVDEQCEKYYLRAKHYVDKCKGMCLRN